MCRRRTAPRASTPSRRRCAATSRGQERGHLDALGHRRSRQLDVTHRSSVTSTGSFWHHISAGRSHTTVTMRPLLFSLAVSAVLAQHAVAHGQTLPPASRTVYKCEVNGKAVYSDSPCLGARRVDVTPKRGLDRRWPKPFVRFSMRRPRNARCATGAPSSALRRERSADRWMHGSAIVEDEERAASRENLEAVQRGLFTARTEHREFGC